MSGPAAAADHPAAKMRFPFWPFISSPSRPPESTATPPAVPGRKNTSGPWIGVDLDGTLAWHDTWRGPCHIGPPVPAMLLRVRDWLAAGHRIKIFTARANDPACHAPIAAWLARWGLPADLEITATKDYDMVECWDDRAIQILPNTGRPVPGSISRVTPSSVPLAHVHTT